MTDTLLIIFENAIACMRVSDIFKGIGRILEYAAPSWRLPILVYFWSDFGWVGVNINCCQSVFKEQCVQTIIFFIVCHISLNNAVQLVICLWNRFWNILNCVSGHTEMQNCSFFGPLPPNVHRWGEIIKKAWLDIYSCIYFPLIKKWRFILQVNWMYLIMYFT
jgi:hypothetical protein